MKHITIGLEDFREVIESNAYYVDKTNLISELMNEKISLFARPRRFGKTLNMSMLYYFFSNKEDSKALFSTLKISKNEKAMKHLNQYPVISFSLKGMRELCMETCLEDFKYLIYCQISSFIELLESPRLNRHDKFLLNKLFTMKAGLSELQNSLQFLSSCLEKHYQKKTIILIDEYDVPLQAAYQNGYYDEMVSFLRNVLSAALKTNFSLQKGVLTGCLRIGKESIFTGLNNLRVYSTSSKKNAVYFGFTQEEVDDLLNYFDMFHHRKMFQNWYDGYSFGGLEIYNPWSVLLCAQDMIEGEYNVPQSYWVNTSGNDIIKDYIEKSDSKMKEEFEILVSGKTIRKRIKEELTYREMNDINNIYSFLLFTGYLKERGKIEEQSILQIPNNEVRRVYINTFEEWFENVQRQTKGAFIHLFLEEKVEDANDILNEILLKSISFYDNYENFYHGLLAGLFLGEGFKLESNKESGDGRFDLAIIPDNYLRRGFVIECKISLSQTKLVEDAQKAIEQIKNKRYIEGLRIKGYSDIIGYGISFYKKSCYISKL